MTIKSGIVGLLTLILLSSVALADTQSFKFDKLLGKMRENDAYGLPSGGGTIVTSNTSYLNQAFTNASTITVNHNFGAYPLVQVLDTSKSVIIPLSIINSSVDTFVVTLATANSGNILVSVGSPQTVTGTMGMSTANADLRYLGINATANLASTANFSVTSNVSITSNYSILSGTSNIALRCPTDDLKWAAINRYGFVADSLGEAINVLPTFNPTTHVFSLGASGTWGYMYDGVLNNFSTSLSINITDMITSTKNYYYIMFDDGTGTMYARTTAWNLENGHVPIATIAWDTSASPNFIMAKEMHTCAIDRRMHYYLHYCLGTRWENGGVLSGYTVAPGAPVNADNTFAMTQTELDDEDIDDIVPALSDTDGTTTTNYMLWVPSGNAYTWDYSSMPYMYTPGGYIQWNNNGVMTQGSSGNWYNTYLFLTNKQGKASAVIICGRGEFGSLPLAQAEDPKSFSFTGFSIDESVIAYQFSWQARNTYSTRGLARLAATPVKIGTAVVQGGSIAPGTFASNIGADTTSFTRVLSAYDNTVQKALNTIDTRALVSTGDASGLVSLNASAINNGTVPLVNLPSTVVTTSYSTTINISKSIVLDDRTIVSGSVIGELVYVSMNAQSPFFGMPLSLTVNGVITADATTTVNLRLCEYMAIGNATGNAVLVLRSGVASGNFGFVAADKGKIVYTSITGTLTLTRPSASNNFIQSVAVVRDINEIDFRPQLTYVGIQ